MNHETGEGFRAGGLTVREFLLNDMMRALREEEKFIAEGKLGLMAASSLVNTVDSVRELREEGKSSHRGRRVMVAPGALCSLGISRKE